MPRQAYTPYSRSRKSVAETHDDIRIILAKAGAKNFGYQEQDNVIALNFEQDGLLYRFMIESSPDDPAETRRKWRVMYDVIKSDLLAVSEGVATFLDRFLSSAVTATGETVSQRMKPELIQQQQKALPPGKGGQNVLR